MSRGALLELGLFLAAAVCFSLSGAWSGGVGGASDPGPRPEGSLRVVTWNVGGARGGGTRLEQADVEHVVESLRELDADLVFLQELQGSWQARSLQESLGSEWSLRFSEPGDGVCLAVFSQRGRLRSRDLDVEAGRYVSVGYRSESGPELLAVGLHADAYSSASRNDLIGSVLDAALGRSRGRAVLLAGDLNLDLDLGKRRDLFSDDAYLDVETYNYVAERLHDVGLEAGTTAEPDRRLDYLFVDPGAFEVVRALVWKRRRVGSMDHDPLVADLRAAGD